MAKYYYVTIKDEVVRVDALLGSDTVPRLIGDSSGTDAAKLLLGTACDGDIEAQVRESWERGYDGDIASLQVQVTALNDTQCQILDRLDAGEDEIQYHPQSVLGGEAIALQKMGLVDLVTDEQGFTYFAPTV